MDDFNKESTGEFDINGLELFIGDTVKWHDPFEDGHFWLAKIHLIDGQLVLLDDKGGYDAEPEWDYLEKIK